MFFTIGANFHATNVCGTYSNIREISVSQKWIYSAVCGVVVGGNSPSMLVVDQMEEDLMLVLRVDIDEVHMVG